MTPFRIRIDARNWFKNIREDGFSTDFDSFYICFLVGALSGTRKEDVGTAETAELVDYFPDRFRERGRLLIGIFLTAELNMLGIEMKEKKIVHNAIAKLVKPESPSYLSDEGVKLFNSYAHGGFDRLLDWFEDKPVRLETFLRELVVCIRDNTGQVLESSATP